jgi:uncharacterized protein with PQ loop repeat
MNDTFIKVIEFMSWSAVSVSIIANLPQIIKMYRTKKVDGLSAWTYSMWVYVTLSMSLRSIFITKDIVFIISESFQFFVVLLITCMIIRYQKR